MNPILAALAQFSRRRAFQQFQQDCHDPQRAQEETLQRLLTRLGHTRRAKRLGLNNVRSRDNFQRLVPLGTFEDYEADIAATLQGEADVMVEGHPVFYSLTSGSSGVRKTLPVTPQYRKDFQSTMNLFLYALQRDHREAFAERALYFVGNACSERAPDGAPMGVLSGYNYQQLPRLLKTIYAAPYEAFTIADPAARLYTIAYCALQHELSSSVAITTQPLAHFGQFLVAHTETLLRDLRDGRFQPLGEVSREVRQALGAYLRPNKKQVRVMEMRASQHGSLAPRYAWPRLRLLACWSHASAGAYREVLRELYGSVAMRSVVYSASEGWINVPLEDDVVYGPLAVRANFYEFLALDAQGQRTGEALFADQLEVGKQYSLVMTSGAGLWRYCLEDVVQCHGFLGKNPQISFVQKEGNVLSLAHDLTTEAQVENAILRLQTQGVVIRRHCFGPGEGLPARYRLVLSVESGQSADELQRAFDLALQESNYLYRVHRRSQALLAAEVSLVSAEVFRRADQAQTAGGVGSQAKPVTFSKNGVFLETLLAGK